MIDEGIVAIEPEDEAQLLTRMFARVLNPGNLSDNKERMRERGAARNIEAPQVDREYEKAINVMLPLTKQTNALIKVGKTMTGKDQINYMISLVRNVIKII